MSNDPKVLVALDFTSEQEALAFVNKVTPENCRLKVGKEMFTLYGPTFVNVLISKGFDVFLDLKFHDIPTTVAKAVKAAAEMGVWMINVHASGGLQMMKQAVAALEGYGKKRPNIIAVTMLTSMDQTELSDIGVNRSGDEHVLSLARLAHQAGLDGVVCSAQEAKLIKSELGKDFLLVTPGIRPLGSELGDQARVMTPTEAIKAGSDYLVIGRPITQSSNPIQILEQINANLTMSNIS